MEYVYAAMLLHSAGKDITEANLMKVLKGPGIKADESRAKALVAALEDVDIDEAISQAAAVPAAAPAAATTAEATAAEPAAEEKKKEEEEETSEEDAMAGLGALFG
ncbi:MAG: 50S ribosomal protein P1 [Candidatus Hydrothermarchaeales archaeon]